MTKSPRKSTGELPSEQQLSSRSVQRMLQTYKFKVYIQLLLNGLLEDDQDQCLQFHEYTLDRHKYNPQLFNKFFWSDFVANFKLNGQALIQ